MRVRMLYIVLSLAATIAVNATQTLVYKKETGGVEATTTYTIEKDEDRYLIQSVSKDQTTNLESLIPYTLISVSYASKKNSDKYTLTLANSVLTADGIMKGEKLHAAYKIPKNSCWIQEFEFGLRPLLSSNKKSIDFQIIHPKNFKIHDMTAKKQGIETLTIGNQSYKAQLVNVTLQGFKSMFWKAQLWYDVTTHDLLMYKANEGPHTPTTTISLISKTDLIN